MRWPDVPAALKRLRKNFLLAPVSNGNISLMVDLARRNEFHWDAILGAEIAGDYKPKPRVYLAACEAFDLKPQQCMMIAAHERSRGCRLRAGCAPAIPHGRTIWTGTGERSTAVKVDVVAKDWLIGESRSRRSRLAKAG
jgi:2-haloacid dehalogenase